MCVFILLDLLENVRDLDFLLSEVRLCVKDVLTSRWGIIHDTRNLDLRRNTIPGVNP